MSRLQGIVLSGPERLLSGLLFAVLFLQAVSFVSAQELPQSALLRSAVRIAPDWFLMSARDSSDRTDISTWDEIGAYAGKTFTLRTGHRLRIDLAGSYVQSRCGVTTWERRIAVLIPYYTNETRHAPVDMSGWVLAPRLGYGFRHGRWRADISVLQRIPFLENRGDADDEGGGKKSTSETTSQYGGTTYTLDVGVRL